MFAEARRTPLAGKRKPAAHLKRAVHKIQIGSKQGKFPGSLSMKILRDNLGARVCSARFQASTCPNLQCPPEGGRYKCIRNLGLGGADGRREGWTGQTGGDTREKLAPPPHRAAWSERDSPLELSRLAHGPPLLETFAAEHGPSLRRAERNCGFLSALRAGRFGFRSLEAIGTWTRALRALGFAVLAPLGLVFEALVGEEHLFAGGEDKFLTTFRTLQDLIVIFHTLLRGSALVGEPAAPPVAV
jgi:hypothetical protein